MCHIVNVIGVFVQSAEAKKGEVRMAMQDEKTPR